MVNSVCGPVGDFRRIVAESWQRYVRDGDEASRLIQSAGFCLILL